MSSRRELKEAFSIVFIEFQSGLQNISASSPRRRGRRSESKQVRVRTFCRVLRNRCVRILSLFPYLSIRLSPTCSQFSASQCSQIRDMFKSQTPIFKRPDAVPLFWGGAAGDCLLVSTFWGSLWGLLCLIYATWIPSLWSLHHAGSTHSVSLWAGWGIQAIS